MKEAVLYYFTGSGNSLVVAKEIQERLINIELIEIASALKKENLKTKAKIVGFVFPCHGFTIPIPVKKFIDKLKLKKTKYIFAVVTRGGTVFNGFDAINKSLSKKKKSLNAAFVIDMPSNDPKFKDYKVPTYDEVLEFHKKMEYKLAILEESVRNTEEYFDDINGAQMVKSPALNKLIEKAIMFSVHNVAPKAKNYFYTTDACIGCGTCSKICPSGKISIKEDKPVWNNKIDCYMCYACLNFCPIESVQIHSKLYMKSYTEENGRYHHPYITPQDMVVRDR